MIDKEAATNLYKMADEFIDVANRLVTSDNQELEQVGAALRYAAARFSAHETAYKSEDLAAERDDAIAWFSNQYSGMLEENLDQHIEHFKSQKNTTESH